MKTVGDLIGQRLPDRVDTCPIHGPYTSVNYLGRVWSRCPVCTEAEKQERLKAEEQAARRERRIAWESKVGASGIPVRFRTRTLDNFEVNNPGQQHALDVARSYADNFSEVLKTGRSLIFIGRPGTGKTHLAVGIGLRIMHAEERTVFFTTVMRAIRRVKDTWAKDARETESQAIAAMTYPDLLILDEVGVQFGSDFERNIMFDILNERYENRKPSILISNLSKDELLGYLGERVLDRMREDGGRIIGFDWGSYRGGATS